MEMCSREEDRQFGTIVLWLLTTEQEAKVSLDGDVYLKPGRHTNKRRKRRTAEIALSAADAKRARKAAKRIGLI